MASRNLRALLRIDRAEMLPLLAANPRAAAKLRRAFAIRLEQLMKALDGVRLELERSSSVPAQALRASAAVQVEHLWLQFLAGAARVPLKCLHGSGQS